MSDSSAISEWMDYGNSRRSTASTKMNERSSRSHAIFTIKMTMVSTPVISDSSILISHSKIFSSRLKYLAETWKIYELETRFLF